MKDYGFLEARDNFLEKYEKENEELFTVIETLLKANGECIYSLTGGDYSMKNIIVKIGTYNFEGIDASQLAKYFEVHPYLVAFWKSTEDNKDGNRAIKYNCNYEL